MILSKGRNLELAMPEMAAAPLKSASHSNAGLITEREKILRVLKDSKGIVSGPNGAARRLGFKRTTLQARMKKLGINRDYQSFTRIRGTKVWILRWAGIGLCRATNAF